MACPDDEEAGTLRRVSLRLLPLLLGLYLLAYLDRVNVGFAALQMNDDLGLSRELRLRRRYPLPRLRRLRGADEPDPVTVGARRWIARIVMTWGLLTCATPSCARRRQFYAARLCSAPPRPGSSPASSFTSAVVPREPPRPGAVRPSHRAAAGAGGRRPARRRCSSRCSGAAGLAGWQWLFLARACPRCCSAPLRSTT